MGDDGKKRGFGGFACTDIERGKLASPEEVARKYKCRKARHDF
jgi:hypothetical protein